MKPTILLAAICFLTASSCGNDATTKSEGVDTIATAAPALSAEEQMIQDAFPNLYMQLKTQDPAFNPAFFQESEGGYGTPPPPRFFPPEELEPFRPYLVYSNDSTKAIDIVSYNYIIDKSAGRPVLEPAGPDTEVGIINLRNNMRTRIFYSGPGTIIREGKWLDSATVLLGGAENVSSTAIRPFLLRVDLKDKSLQRFTYTDSVKARL